MQSFAEVKLCRGLAMCRILLLQSVGRYQNNDLQHRIVKTLDVPPSTAHQQKIQRIWRHLCTHGTWPKSILLVDARDLQACIKNTRFSHENYCMGSGTLLEIVVCEHSSPCHPQIQVEALSCKEKAICETLIQKCCSLLWAEAHFQLTEAKWETDLWSDVWNWNLKYFFETMCTASPGLKRRGTIWLVISSQFKILHLWWYMGELVPMEVASQYTGFRARYSRI